MGRDPNKICIVVTGATRPDSLKCNLEILKYSLNEYDYHVIVSYSGDNQWEPYLEDDTIQHGRMGIQLGCSRHLNTAISSGRLTDCRYLLYINSDVMVLHESFIVNTINRMKENNKFIAGNSSGYPNGHPYNIHGICTQWVFFDLDWDYGLDKIFPLPETSTDNNWWHSLEQTFGFAYCRVLADERNEPYQPYGYPDKMWPGVHNSYTSYLIFIDELEPGPNATRGCAKYDRRYQGVEGGICYSHHPDVLRDCLKLFGFPHSPEQETITKLVEADDSEFYPWVPPYERWEDAWFDKGALFHYNVCDKEYEDLDYMKNSLKEWEIIKDKARLKFNLQ
mgnify:CR=1 FL=1